MEDGEDGAAQVVEGSVAVADQEVLPNPVSRDGVKSKLLRCATVSASFALVLALPVNRADRSLGWIHGPLAADWLRRQAAPEVGHASKSMDAKNSEEDENEQQEEDHVGQRWQ